MEKHPLHIKNPELQKSEEVEKAVEKQERISNEKMPNDPNMRIEAYMDRLEKIFLNQNKRVRERNLDMLRDKIYDTLIIKKENFPESYFELQKRIARERGQHVEEIPSDIREQMMDVAIEDQKHSLDAWVEYLTEEDVAYPTWFKFYVWNQVIKLSQFDKELGKFKRRNDGTIARFPDIHRGALARILDIYDKYPEEIKEAKTKLNKSQLSFKENPQDEKLKAEVESQKEVVRKTQEEFDKKFPSLYAELISESLATQIENKEEIRGEWVKYHKNNNTEADKLYESMQSKGTGWCVEGKNTAHSYIDTGDFYVYYTNDTEGNPTQPRLAIQMTGNQIGQIRPMSQIRPICPILKNSRHS